VAYGFDATRLVVWFDTLRGEGPQAGRLCARHAGSMVVPKGWWLDDRRDAEALFPSPPVAVAVAEPAEPARPKRSAKKSAARTAPAAAPAPVVESEPGWTPFFDTTDDLDGQLNASTPLLARAFGQGPVRPAPAKRSRKRPPDTAVG
jgi:hypothetical protein